MTEETVPDVVGGRGKSLLMLPTWDARGEPLVLAVVRGDGRGRRVDETEETVDWRDKSVV